jgi:cell division protein FtsW (lipid II flippase)
MSADEHVKAQLTPEGKFALLLILCEVVVFAIALFFNQPELGMSACISIAILLIVLRATWKLREHGWYWGAVVVAVAIQIPVIFYVPWSNHAYRGTALVAFGFLDFIVLWGGIKLCEKTMKRS